MHSPSWALELSQRNGVGFFQDMFSPVPWEQFEQPSAGTVFSALGLDDIKAANFTPLENEVTKYFGIKVARRGNEDKEVLEKHLRPFVIERQPEETQRAAQALLDPNSKASMQILISYMVLLFSNELVGDDAIEAFISRAEELHQLGSLKPLFLQESPSARAVQARLLHASIRVNATIFLSQALKDGADLECPSTGEKSMTLLQNALKSERNEAARILIDTGANVNVGVTAMHSNKGCTDCFSHLKSFTCDCEKRDLESPMVLAARSRDCVDLIPLLFTKGAILTECSPALLFAIIHEASVDTVSCLINAGADVNQCTIGEFLEETTPLSAAAARRNLQVVQLLLDAGADPNGLLKQELSEVFSYYGSLDHQFPSPLLCATKTYWEHYGDSCGIARLLLKFGANPNLSAVDVILKEGRWISQKRVSELLCDDNDDGMGSWITYPLQAAAERKDIELTKLLLQHKASVHSTYGTPALTVAISNSNIETARLLLTHNADPNWLGKQLFCRSALEEAVQNRSLELIDLLLESGADINQCSSAHGGRTPLQRAAKNGDEQVIEHLLKHGASMLSPPAPTKGASVLQGFVENRLHEYVSKALKAGANPNGDSKDSSSPLNAAVVNNDTTSIHLLLVAGAEVNEYSFADRLTNGDRIWWYGEDRTLNEKRLSPIQWAAAMNHLEVARILCDAGANVNQPAYAPEGEMALHLAVRHRNYDMVNFLVAKNVKVDAYSFGDTALILSIYKESASILELLLRNGADPNQLGLSGWDPLTPLDRACAKRNFSAVQALLCAGADASQGFPLMSIFSNTSEEIPVMSFLSGCSYSSGCREILEILLRYGADANRRRHDRDTPLQKAILEEEFDCAYRLIEVGACINDIASKGRGGCTALQAAVSVGQVDMVEHLLSKGADVNAPAAVVNGVTALQAAAIKGYLRIAQILLEHGADIDAKAGIGNGRTAIEGAAEFGRIDMVKLLLDNYHGPKSIRQMCERAYKAAKRGNQWYVMELLEAYEHPGQSQ